MIDTDRGFTLVRQLDATPDRIWAAWTDPDQIAEWWHPRGVTTPRETVSVDARVGGEYTYTMVDELTGGGPIVTAGIYREVVPKEKLVFTWGEPTIDDADRPVVTVTIKDLGELTRLTFDLRGADGVSGDGFLFDGWESALDVLVEFLGQAGVRG
jgi:uncharacterized protein YndB with AHSA1/START domain